MARKKTNARKVVIDQVTGYCTHHECMMRYKRMAQKDCLRCNAETGGKCKYLIDREARA